MEKEIASFNKNSMETVKVRLQDYQDKQYLDIRVWTKGGPKGEDPHATGKGITIHVDHLSELRRALDTAMAELAMGGEKPGTDGGQD